MEPTSGWRTMGATASPSAEEPRGQACKIAILHPSEALINELQFCTPDPSAHLCREGYGAVLKQSLVGGFVIDLASSLRNSPNPWRSSPTFTSKSLAIWPRDSPSASLLKISSSGLSILSAIETAATN